MGAGLGAALGAATGALVGDWLGAEEDTGAMGAAAGDGGGACLAG